MKEKKSTKNTVLGCLGILIIIVIIALLFHSCTKTNKEDTTSTIITITQNAVKNNLKSPSTASFPWSNDEYQIKEVTSDNNINNYYISGHVDSENNYGIKTRSNFIVKLELTDNGEKYKILDVQIS